MNVDPVAHFLATYQGLDYKCTVDGPHSPFALITEAPVAVGRFGHWPLGRECEWPLADGTGTIVAHSESWTGTFALVSSLVIAFGGLVLTAVGNFTRRDRA